MTFHISKGSYEKVNTYSNSAAIAAPQNILALQNRGMNLGRQGRQGKQGEKLLYLAKSSLNSAPQNILNTFKYLCLLHP